MNLGGIVLLTSRHYNLFFFSFAFSQIRNTKDKICKCVPRNLGTWFCPWLLWNARDKCSRGRAAHTEALWAAPVDELYRRDSLGSGGGWYSKKTSAQKIWGDSPIVLAGWVGAQEDWFSPSEGDLTLAHKIICACIVWLTDPISRNLSPIVWKCMCADVFIAVLLVVAKYWKQGLERSFQVVSICLEFLRPWLPFPAL